MCVPAAQARQQRRTCPLSHPPFTQVLPLGASKGAGVEWLLERLGVAPENVMALGDAENDVEMLRVGAGHHAARASVPCRAVLVCPKHAAHHTSADQPLQP